MATNTVRSVVIFSVIAIGFIGLAAGGMFFMKSRNHALATTATQQSPQQASPQTAQPTSTEEQKKPDVAAPKDDGKAEEKPAPAQVSTPTPAATPDNKSANEQAAATATPTAVPATGPSLPGMVATMLLMMAAAYFGGQLMRARNAYRRHLEG